MPSTDGVTPRKSISETMFLSIYGSPALQAAVGIDPDADAIAHAPECRPQHRKLLDARIAELDHRSERAA